MEGCEDGHCPTQRNNASSPATSYSHQSTATLTPSPHEETRAPHDLPRFNQQEGQQLSRYVDRHDTHSSRGIEGSGKPQGTRGVFKHLVLFILEAYLTK